ncbi:hypothetical protein [Pedobacter endophyticus]|uniref:DUF559 domain-containing protein n=1 Tax=Pedobacter endophyticus TaxID=2789740 RepID=A0A7U3Q5E7_9SPHI|nr:hypothetical protein [Pedobacter endophyticus]QPH38889.1 hypothetical protein IZT61_17755 [Pedobacter endophyticus]
MDNFTGHINSGQPRADRDRLESPLEEQFIQSLEKYLNPRSEIIPQFELETILGRFRLDFVIELDGYRIGFECDGKAYHDAFRDEWRDALILHTKQIDTIYRFRGKDIFSFLDDCIYVIYKHDPFIFNDRYQHHCDVLATASTINYFITDEANFRNHEDTFIGIELFDDNGKKRGEMELQTIRRSQNSDGHWKDLINITLANPGLSLDELIASRKVNF